MEIEGREVKIICNKVCVYEIGVDLEIVFFGLLYLKVETVGLLKSLLSCIVQ